LPKERSGIDDGSGAHPTDISIDHDQAVFQPMRGNPHEAGRRRHVPRAGNRHAITGEIDDDALRLQAGNPQNPVGTGHHGRPDDGQAYRLERQIAGLKLIDAYRRHARGARDSVE
jgi:hypothetical protein